MPMKPYFYLATLLSTHTRAHHITTHTYLESELDEMQGYEGFR